MTFIQAMLRAITKQRKAETPHVHTPREEDFVRENKVDREFRKRLLLPLIGCFQNKCALCGTDGNGLDLDHAIVPKSKGGNFVLSTPSGPRLNAIPLCQSCNRSKGAKDIVLPEVVVQAMVGFQDRRRDVLQDILDTSSTM